MVDGLYRIIMLLEHSIVYLKYYSSSVPVETGDEEVSEGGLGTRAEVIVEFTSAAWKAILTTCLLFM